MVGPRAHLLGPWTWTREVLLKLVKKSYCYKLTGSFTGWILNITPLKVFGLPALTLSVQVFRWPKKYLLPIQHSRPSRFIRCQNISLIPLRYVFLRLSHLSVFIRMDKHLDGAWGLRHIMNKISQWHFHSISNEGIWYKKIKLHARIKKSHFGNFSKTANWNINYK